MKRFIYIVTRIGIDFLGLVSRAFNAMFLGGSTSQTTSAHCHINPNIKTLRKIINAVFFFQDDHCAWAWQEEVSRAWHTLNVYNREIEKRQLNEN